MITAAHTLKYYYACENMTESGVPAEEPYVLHGNSGESIVRYNAIQVDRQTDA